MRNGAAPPAAAAALLACLFGAVTWQVFADGPLTAADVPVHEWVLRHGLDQSSPLWVVPSELGDGRISVPVLAVVAAVTWWRLRRRALRPLGVAAAGLAVFTVVLEVMKATIARADPGSGSDRVFAGGGAFPSGHASGATVVWGLAVWLAVVASAPAHAEQAAGPLGAARRFSGRPRVSRYSCLIAGGAAGLVAGAAMVRMGFHWVSDVAGGWLLGMTTLLAVLAATEALAHRPALTQRADLVRGEPGSGEDGVGVRAREPRR